jgi:hypothetical protein
MTAPSPALRRLYRQAATPARWLAKLRQADTLIERFEFDLRRAGLDAEIALEGLLTPVSLDAALGGIRLADGTPAATGPGQPDQMDARSHRLRAGLDKFEPTDRLPTPLRPGTASIESDPTHAAGSNPPPAAGCQFDPQSHPRLALLQTLARVDLPSLQRRYGLLDNADATADAATATRPPGRTASADLAPQHSAADAQVWLDTLARRANVPDAANQPLALRAPQAGHGPDRPSQPINASADTRHARTADDPRALPASASAANHPAPAHTDRPTAEPFDNNPPALGSLQRLLQRFDPARPTMPSATSASAATSAAASAAAGSMRSVLPAEPAWPADIAATDAADSRHPAAAAAAALRTELRRSTPPPQQGSRAETAADPARQPAQQARSTAAARTASASPSWTAPVGGFRGLAALGRAAESAGLSTPAPADAAPPHQPFGPSADALRDSIDAEQLAELLRQQARRHGIDLTEFEP